MTWSKCVFILRYFLRHERYLGFVSDAPRASIDVAPGGPATISSSDMVCFDASVLCMMVRKVDTADRLTTTASALAFRRDKYTLPSLSSWWSAPSKFVNHMFGILSCLTRLSNSFLVSDYSFGLQILYQIYTCSDRLSFFVSTRTPDTTTLPASSCFCSQVSKSLKATLTKELVLDPSSSTITSCLTLYFPHLGSAYNHK
jgi:hypothetical protein